MNLRYKPPLLGKAPGRSEIRDPHIITPDRRQCRRRYTGHPFSEPRLAQRVELRGGQRTDRDIGPMAHQFISERRTATDAGGVRVGNADGDPGERRRPVRMVRQLWLPERVAGRMRDERHVAFRRGFWNGMHVVKLRQSLRCVTLRCVIAAEGRQPLTFQPLTLYRSLDETGRCADLITGLVGILETECDAMSPLVAAGPITDLRIERRLRDADRFEITVPEHRAMVAGSPRNGWASRLPGSDMLAAGRQGDSKLATGRVRPAEIRHRHAGMIERHPAVLHHPSSPAARRAKSLRSTLLVPVSGRLSRKITRRGCW